jgi:glycosyltransferase involved in cell wall biosynthesis
MTEGQPRVSVVIPAYQEADAIDSVLERLLEGITIDAELLVVVDDPSDSTVPAVQRFTEGGAPVEVLVNTYGRGPALAIRYGIDHAAAPVVVVTMADGSDDATQIDDLCRLVERGVVIAAASRYMSGGRQIGGPFMKSLLSRMAGLSLFVLARVGTRDATNSFKAYRREFVRAVGIDSDSGFELGLELVAKARRLREPVAELPTIWIERHVGMSRFKLFAWLPRYLHWYAFAFGRALTLVELRRRSSRRSPIREDLPT